MNNDDFENSGFSIECNSLECDGYGCSSKIM